MPNAKRSAITYARVRKLVARGIGKSEIARRLGVGRDLVYRALAADQAAAVRRCGGCGSLIVTPNCLACAVGASPH